MLDKFLIELEELLHASPYSSVDIFPLVNKYTHGKTYDESGKIRLKISSLLEQLKKLDHIQVGNDYNILLNSSVHDKFSESPIYVRGTIKFENYYKENHTNDNKKLKLLKQTWELISNNILISGIILAIVLYFIFGIPK